jgi:hypothetical protein
MFTQMRTLMALQHALVFERKLQGEQHIPEAITTRDILEFATVEGARANDRWIRWGPSPPCLRSLGCRNRNDAQSPGLKGTRWETGWCWRTDCW